MEWKITRFPIPLTARLQCQEGNIKTQWQHFVTNDHKFQKPQHLCITTHHLDDVQAHVDQVFGAGAVIASSRVAFERITQISTLKVVVAKVIVTSPGSKNQKASTKDTSLILMPKNCYTLNCHLPSPTSHTLWVLCQVVSVLCKI